MIRWMIAVVLVAGSAAADIEWEQKEVTLDVHPTQTSAEAVYHFTNTGDSTAFIDNVAISCGCLSAKPFKHSYAPGEKGELVVRFSLLGRTGKQRKHVVVETRDGKRTDLVLSAEIPEAYRAEPTMVLWKKDDKDKQKTVHLTNSNAQPIKLRSMTSSRKELPAELKIIREGFEYEVTVSRNTEDSNVRSVIRIEMEPPPGQKDAKTLKLYVIAM